MENNGNICPCCGFPQVKLYGVPLCLTCIPETLPEKAPALPTNVGIQRMSRAALYKHPDAISYIRSRGITPEDLSKWRIGFVDDTIARKLSSKGTPYAWRDRILFPIVQDGEIVAFGGRRFRQGDERFKYLNSDSGVYDKSSVLYGYDFVKEGGDIYICEGFLDVISMQRKGYDAVASCGTAFTGKQALKVAAKHPKRVFLASDMDDPGKASAIRTAKVLIDTGLFTEDQILRLTWEDAKDVDEALNKGISFGSTPLIETVEKKAAVMLLLRKEMKLSANRLYRGSDREDQR